MAESTGTNKITRGVVAEYDTPDALLDAANRVREAGYTKTDAFSPFPVHGIDDAIGIKPTVLPWIVLGAGITGCLLGMGMEYWMNAHEYPYIISGKPYFSMPAFIPVSFELTILFSSFAAFFGQWILNGLPRFSNPMFTSPKFDAATDDKFFLYIDARDPRFDQAGARTLLDDTKPLSVEDVVEDDSPEGLPKIIKLAVAILVVLAAFPPLIILNMRVSKSGTPRIHIFWDMDFMPSKGPQEATTLFADGRTMRPKVAGTVARGDLELDMDFQTGIQMDKLAQIDPVRATRLVNLVTGNQQADEGDEGSESEEGPGEGDPGSEGDEGAPSEETEASGGDQDTPAEEPASEEGDAPEEGEAGDDPPAEENSDPPAEEPESTEPSEPQKTDTPEQEPAPAEPKDSDPPAEPSEDPAPAEPKDSDPPAEPSEDPAPAEPTEEPETPAPSPSDNDTPAEQPSAPEAPAPAAAGEEVDNTPWVTENPLGMTESTINYGRKRFEIYCAVCHGRDGFGNGLVNQRAKKILATTWSQPSSLHEERLQQDKMPDGKIFNTITNGIRKMPGYAGQIPVKDRWAIIAYLRVLQASRNVPIEDIPSQYSAGLKKQADEQKKAIEAAEAARLKKQAEKKAAEAAKSQANPEEEAK